MQSSLLVFTTLVIIQPISDRSYAAVRIPIIILPKHFITANKYAQKPPKNVTVTYTENAERPKLNFSFSVSSAPSAFVMRHPQVTTAASCSLRAPFSQ